MYMDRSTNNSKAIGTHKIKRIPKNLRKKSGNESTSKFRLSATTGMYVYPIPLVGLKCFFNYWCDLWLLFCGGLNKTRCEFI